MRAYLLEAPRILSLMDIPVPALEDDEVLLKTQRVSICATDVNYFRGAASTPGWPVIPGHEHVGEVVDVGRHVEGIRMGDLIAYWGQTDFGALAEYRAIRPLLAGSRLEQPFHTDRGMMDDRRAAAVVLDSGSDLDQASLLEPTTSVLRTLLQEPPRPGDNALILGAGPCGLIALQILRWQGVHEIIMLDHNRDRLALAKELGANAAFHPMDDSDAVERLARDTQNAHVQYALDTLTDVPDDAPDSRALALRLMSPQSRYVLFGVAGRPQRIDLWPLLSMGVSVKAAPFDVRAYPMWRTAHVLALAKRAIQHGMIRLNPLITHRPHFSDVQAVQQAFTLHATGGRMKTVVRFDPIEKNHPVESSP